MSEIADLQKEYRDEGWRIKWISWTAKGKPEYVYNTPLTLLLSIFGFMGIIVSMGFIVHYSGTESVYIPLILFIVCMVFLLSVKVYATRHKQLKWKRISAKCLDREIRQVSAGDGGLVWTYRLLCNFTYLDIEYQVTPENPHSGFISKSRQECYLNSCIGSDGNCRLFIDPSNPLHSVFNKKQII